MISTLIIGAVIELLGAIYMIYHLSQENFSEHWTLALIGAVVMVAGMILLYSTLRYTPPII